MDKKGFTLAEMLIVVGVIAVLVAVAIPIFNTQLEKSREAHDIYVMREAATAAEDLLYQGAVTKEGAAAVGLKWWNDGTKDANAAGVYNPGSGTFSPIGSKDAKKAYGKGTKTSINKNYWFLSREMYKSGEDYTNAVVLVAIYPAGHMDVYWKDIKTGKYIGGQGSGANDPKYSIRVDIR